jgi:hypothetical protein
MRKIGWRARRSPFRIKPALASHASAVANGKEAMSCLPLEDGQMLKLHFTSIKRLIQKLNWIPDLSSCKKSTKVLSFKTYFN